MEEKDTVKDYKLLRIIASILSISAMVAIVVALVVVNGMKIITMVITSINCYRNIILN